MTPEELLAEYDTRQDELAAPVQQDSAALQTLPGQQRAFNPEDLLAEYDKQSARADPALGLSINAASSANPSVEIERVRLGRELGRPPELVGDISAAKAEIFRSRNNPDELAARAPGLAKALAGSPVLAKIARDHLDVYTAVETEVRNLGKSLQHVPPMITSAVFGLARAQAELKGFSGAPFAAKTKEYQAKADAVKVDTSEMGPVRRGVYSGIQSFGTTAALLGVSVAARSPAPLMVGAPAISAGSGYNEARETKGIGESFNYATRQAAISAVTEAYSGLALFKGATGATGLKEAIKKFALGEVVGEQAATFFEDMNRWATLNPDKTMEEFIAERPDAAIETAVATLVGGGAQVGAMAGLRKITDALPKRQEAQAQHAVKAWESLNAIHQQVAENPLRKESPETVQEILSAISDTPESITEVFVPSAVLNEVLNQSGGMENFLAVAPKTRASMQDAATLPAMDVRIPMAEYLTILAGSPEGAKLTEHVKVSEGGMTFLEAKKFYAQERASFTTTGVPVTDKVLTREEFEAQNPPTPPQPVEGEDTLLTREEFEAEQEMAGANAAKQELFGIGGDRRVDSARRKNLTENLAELQTPAEREAYVLKELYTDDLTGLGNLRAYQEVKKKKFQGSIDADSLKWINDNLSPGAGDLLLKSVGVALREEGVDAYHISGDEYMVQGDTQEEIDAVMSRVNERLKHAVIRVQRPDGKILEKRGVEVTYAVGRNKNYADYLLKKEKIRREAAGLRAGRGEQPKGVLTIASEGEQDSQRDAAAPSYEDYVAQFEAEQKAKAQAKGPAKQAQTYEQYLAAHPSQQAVREKDAQSVYATLLAQMENTKRYPSAVNEVNALIMRDWYMTQAARLGTLPSELYTRYPLKITAEGLVGHAQGAIGGFDPNTLTIAFLRGADLSTPIHESAHFYLEAMMDLSSASDAPTSIVADVDKALAWFGVTREAWQGMSADAKRPYHEQWAQSFERFTLEGNAPSPELQSVFSRMRVWMLKTYRSLEAFLSKNTQAGKLDDEMRGVFRRMLAAQDIVLETQENLGHQVLFPSAEAAGIGKSEYEAYLAMEVEATEEAIEDMAERSLRDMRWLSNAKNKVLKSLQNKANDLREEIRQEITEQVMAEPVNIARAVLLNRDSGLKFHRDALREIDPDVDADTSKLKGMSSATLGVHPDEVADAFGFQSGVELLEALANEPDAQTKIDGIVDQRMLEEHGELVDEREIERAANVAVHNSGRTKFIATGLKILTKSPIPARELIRAAKETALGILESKSIREIRPKMYDAAEARAHKAALLAVASDPNAAIRAQREALLSNILSRRGSDALQEVDRGVAYLNRARQKASKTSPNKEYAMQLSYLLGRFGLAPAQERPAVPLSEWVVSEAEKTSAVLPDIPMWVMDESTEMHYKDLTMDEFRDVLAAVKGLRTLAKREREQYKAIRGMTFAAEKSAILARLQQFNPEAFDAQGAPKKIDPEFVPKVLPITKIGEALKGEFLNAENIVSVMEGGQFGQVHESLLGRLSTALDTKAQMLGDLHKLMAPLLKAYSIADKVAFSRKDIGAVGDVRVTRETAVVITLLNGNKEGRDRLANYGWTEEQVQSAADMLTDRDMDLVEGIWKLFDTVLWPELKALNERTRGNAPPKVEAVPFSVRGRVLTGGYFKLMSDTKRSGLPAGTDTQATGEGALAAMRKVARTAQGSSEARVQTAAYLPRLDLGVFVAAINETVHDITMREAVVDTSRLLRDPTLRTALINVAGEPSYLAIQTRLFEVAVGPRDPFGVIEKTLSIARKNTIVAMLSGLGTALQNVTGLASTMGRLENPARVAPEIVKFFSPLMASRVKFAESRSTYLANRHQSFDRDLQRVAKEFTVEGSFMPSMPTFLWFMRTVDKGVSTITWNVAYREGLKKFANAEQKAIDYADQIVRQTQGSGRELDVANIMGGQGPAGELKKVFTMFGSYFNAQLGLLVRSGLVNAKLAKKNPALAALLFTKDFLLVFAVPAMLTTAVFSGNAPSDEDEEAWHKYLIGMARYGFGMVPVFGNFGSFVMAENTEYTPDYGYRLSPIQTAFESISNTPAAITDIVNDENTTQDIKNAIMGVSYAIGLPGRLIANTATGIPAVLEGEAGPKALLYGAPKESE